MQWAKPRDTPGRVDGRMTDKIRIALDVPTESDAPDRSADQSAPRTTSTRLEDDYRSSYSNWGSGSYTNTYGQGTFADGQMAHESIHNDDSVEESAWNYYSGNTYQYNDAAQGQWDSPGMAFEGQQPGQQYRGDTGYQKPYQNTSSNYKAPSTDFESTINSNDGGNSIRQFIAPFLVAGLVIFLAFLTLLN